MATPQSVDLKDKISAAIAVTLFGLRKVAVLPYIAVADGNIPMKPKDSSFYYLACEPFYHCKHGGSERTSICSRRDLFRKQLATEN